MPGFQPLGRLEGGFKIQLFKNMVMLHIKQKGVTNAETW